LGQKRLAKNPKKAIKLGATLVFMDESAISLRPVVMKTWAPSGKTPSIICKTRSHQKISAIGAVVTTPRCRRMRMFFRLHAGKNVTADDCVAFCEQLKQNIQGPIILVWDRLTAHRSKKVNRYLEKQNGRVMAEYFPPYAPELNPIEYGWSYLKTKSLYNYAAECEAILYEKAKDGLCGIRKQKRLLRSFLKKSGLFP
jgi:transposase